jgi:glycosyltransferase involved in cell wall biosynthesis
LTLHFQVVIIIPCFNEAKRINSTQWINYIQDHPNYFFVFVNDGSKDETAVIIEAIAKKYKNIEIITDPKNQGKASAVRKGILYSFQKYSFELIAFIDADLSTPLAELDKFEHILLANKQVDILLGSRVQMLGKKIQRNLFRHYIGRIIATFICKILNEPVYDTQCGLKMFRKNIAYDLINEDFICKWLFDVEILARYKIKYGSKSFNEKLMEIPVKEWTEKQNSKLRYYQFMSIIFELIRIKRKYFSNTRL